MPTPEMLKQLLDEFEEKEAHTREEINAITEQIDELERRVISSRKRLESVAVDREKVNGMMSRYTGGIWQIPTAGTVGTSSGSSSSESPTAKGDGGNGASKARKDESSSSAEQKSSLSQSLRSGEGSREAKISMPARQSSSRLRSMMDSPAQAEEAAAAAATASSSPFVAPTVFDSPVTDSSTRHSPVSAAIEDLFQSPMPEEPVQGPTPSEPATAPAYEFTKPEEAAMPPWPGGAPAMQNPLPQATAPTPVAPPPPSPPAPAVPSPAAALSKSSFFSEPDPEFEQLAAPEPEPPAPAASAPPAPAPSLAMPKAPMSAGFGDDDEFEREMEAKAAQQSAAAPPPTPAASDAAAASELDDETDDTVKSINDALRGLFR